ncbi:hypothetical protein [Microvirga arsenatis]|uniref:Uncharacterized protein n=1 Tax=Microvirga arsenatis TaxID=2692265 RepID=A0ABW9Z7I5_9HYPH|nr:hypothetical protein [Microvirga arsenatis]NBJ13682.1 hypothetical protein [Microvirga arsenatis]NBJ27168.1 hypothetical protein [Microvirga arsenatis]
MTRLSFLPLGLVLLHSPAIAGDSWLYLGPQRPDPKIIKLEGFGTEEARAEAQVTDRDIKDFCDNFHPGQTWCRDAVRHEFPKPIVASANCLAGTITTANGDELVYAGERKSEGYGDSPNLTLWKTRDGKEFPRGAIGGVPAQNWSVLCGLNFKPRQAQQAQATASPTPQLRGTRDKNGVYTPTMEEWLEMLNDQPYIHNGSEVGVNFSKGYIKYWTPKASIAGTISADTILFQGTFTNVPKLELRGTVAGTAYVFKRGCEPAPYRVTGTYSNGRIILRGASPQRAKNSCEISGYSTTSPNAVLEFTERPEHH